MFRGSQGMRLGTCVVGGSELLHKYTQLHVRVNWCVLLRDKFSHVNSFLRTDVGVVACLSHSPSDHMHLVHITILF